MNPASRNAELDELLDQIGNALREQSPTLDDLIESGRAIREELVRELYGLGNPPLPGTEVPGSQRSAPPGLSTTNPRKSGEDRL